MLLCFNKNNITKPYQKQQKSQFKNKLIAFTKKYKICVLGKVELVKSLQVRSESNTY